MSHIEQPEAPAGKTRVIFRPWITKPDGTKLYARNYGLKAFRIELTD